MKHILLKFFNVLKKQKDNIEISQIKDNTQNKNLEKLNTEKLTHEAQKKLQYYYSLHFEHKF